eukprot:193385-Chlamydomonas_euryale.AAC.1
MAAVARCLHDRTSLAASPANACTILPHTPSAVLAQMLNITIGCGPNGRLTARFSTLLRQKRP